MPFQSFAIDQKLIKLVSDPCASFQCNTSLNVLGVDNPSFLMFAQKICNPLLHTLIFQFLFQKIRNFLFRQPSDRAIDLS